MARESLPLRLSFALKKLYFIFQFFKKYKNWIRKAKLGKCRKCSKYFQYKIGNTHMRHCCKNVQFSEDFRTDGAHISKKFIITFIKKLPKNTTL